MTSPQLIRVKKYPNRRLYDGSRSRHLTHEELYDLVVAGHTVSVTDSRTGEDITNLVLIQAMLERSPEKLAAFPPEVSHLLIRTSEQMLRIAAQGWLSQLLRSMAPIPGAPFPFVPPFWPGGRPSSEDQPTPSAESSTAPPPDGRSSSPDLMQQVEALRREVESLKHKSNARAKRSSRATPGSRR
ncbi:MAG: polyhydroxyalkanoate synthesis regulator DNA-binding domain-containing protein [Phycisphaeraceae bacterium]|nr:polyhydroxyalkanoate synthesis regulator DNA-binding domain-containing protein [Phycisphaeraceae bacterium]